jgi:hypothetical protein
MKRNILLTSVIAIAMLCGCSNSKQQTELSEDTPYNHGENVIMETDKGYYTNSIGGTMCLRYYEKDTENQIFVCARPECLHNGSETCTATYKNLYCVNSVLYNDAIYILTIEGGDTVSVSLYKAALDGTSITKVGTAFSVNNSAGEDYKLNNDNDDYFMIHKGYAYIPYHISLGDGTYGFAGSGLVKMDISSGKTEQLYSGDDYFSPYPAELAGSGDHVYYNCRGYKITDATGTYRYNIVTGESEKLSDNVLNLTYGERKLFSYGLNDDGTYCVSAHDISDMDFTDGWENISDYVFRSEPEIIPYEDKVITVDKSQSIIYMYSENGGILGQIEYPDENDQVPCYFSVSDDKLYMRVHPVLVVTNEYDEWVYSVSLEDIEKGKAEWKLEYGIKNTWRFGLGAQTSRGAAIR